MTCAEQRPARMSFASRAFGAGAALAGGGPADLRRFSAARGFFRPPTSQGLTV